MKRDFRKGKPSRPREKDDLLFGVHPVLEAIEAGAAIDRILLKKGLDPETRKNVTTAAEQAGIPWQTVPPEKLDFLLRDKNHQGVAAFSGMIPYAKLDEVIAGLFETGKDPLFLLLDGVTDVRNFGAIARSAECLGANAIIIPEQGSVRVNGEAIRISSGALNHLPVCRVKHLVDAIHIMQQNGIRIVAVHENGKLDIRRADLSGPLCIVMGSEGEGIQPRIIRLADETLQIPMQGKISSLNVSVAAGILLFWAGKDRS